MTVTAAKDCFVASARIYAHYNLPPDQYLAEATASRGYLPDKPTVSPREWAQTAAVGIALRNAGFGLQFSAAGDSFDTPAVDELGAITWSTAPAGEAPHRWPDRTCTCASNHGSGADRSGTVAVGEGHAYPLPYHAI